MSYELAHKCQQCDARFNTYDGMVKHEVRHVTDTVERVQKEVVEQTDEYGVPIVGSELEKNMKIPKREEVFNLLDNMDPNKRVFPTLPVDANGNAYIVQKDPNGALSITNEWNGEPQFRVGPNGVLEENPTWRFKTKRGEYFAKFKKRIDADIAVEKNRKEIDALGDEVMTSITAMVEGMDIDRQAALNRKLKEIAPSPYTFPEMLGNDALGNGVPVGDSAIAAYSNQYNPPGYTIRDIDTGAVTIQPVFTPEKALADYSNYFPLPSNAQIKLEGKTVTYDEFSREKLANATD